MHRWLVVSGAYACLLIFSGLWFMIPFLVPFLSWGRVEQLPLNYKGLKSYLWCLLSFQNFPVSLVIKSVFFFSIKFSPLSDTWCTLQQLLQYPFFIPWLLNSLPTVQIPVRSSVYEFVILWFLSTLMVILKFFLANSRNSSFSKYVAAYMNL